ncbi:MAG: ATP-grasp domain-containing protein, partial [Caulobacterales bacterium]|nr:ATP-grasp domain-containing protein [Caulobacterales bacterium]
MIKKLLIANRGEIACRIIKTAKKLGIKTIAIHSNIDCNARFVKLADESYSLSGIDASETYLDIEKIINIAKQNGADAIHPGYGFLSENAQFARQCQENNIIFVGAQAEAIEAMGLKDSAKKIAKEAGVPILSGYMGSEQNADFLLKEAEKIGFPILIKAIAGGGGRGIRQVENSDEFMNALQSAKREAKSAFNDERMMLEKLVIKPRHIEVQVFGDKHGNVVHLFERDCSVQRRRQKLIEEAPAPNLPQNVREAMFNAAVKLAKAVNYHGAGTIEFIVDGNGVPSLDGFWFLEMNTRLQVEHPVTEAITGLDLVEWQ